MAEPIETSEQTPPVPAHANGDPAAAPQGEQPPVKTFTQDDLDRIVAKRVSKAEKAAEKRVRTELTQTLSGKQEAPPQPEPTAGESEAVKTMRAEIDKMRSDLEFKDALVGKKLTQEQMAKVRKVTDPETRQEMVDLYDKHNSLIEDEPKGDDSPVYRSPGGAGAPLQVERELDATKWSAEQIDQMQENGTFLEEVEKFRGSLAGGNNSIFSKRPIRKP